MKYLKSILFIFLCTITTNLYAQGINETIERQFKEYIQLSFEDFEKSLDYTPEEVFETISKEEMILIHEYGSNQLKGIYLKSAPIMINISETIKIENTNYVKFQSSYKIQIDLNISDNVEENISYFKSSYEEIYGSENITFDQETYTFEINQIVNMIAISENLKNWKFVSIDNVDLNYLHFIPKQLFE